jgi:hypothetical protein
MRDRKINRNPIFLSPLFFCQFILPRCDFAALGPSPRFWRLGMLGAHTGAAAICLAPGLGHPRIRDSQRSEDSINGVTHCKHGGAGVGDKFCTPIQCEMKTLGLERGAEAESGSGMRFALAFCALPGFRNGHRFWPQARPAVGATGEIGRSHFATGVG